MTDIHNIIKDAISEFDDRLKDQEVVTDVGDIIHEVADS